jgi:hypothetical protein
VFLCQQYKNLLLLSEKDFSLEQPLKGIFENPVKQGIKIS